MGTSCRVNIHVAVGETKKNDSFSLPKKILLIDLKNRQIAHQIFGVHYFQQ